MKLRISVNIWCVQVSLVIDALSRERLTPYLVATGQHEEAAVALYAWSMSLSAAFYPLLGVVEVALRNAIANRIRALHGTRWWEAESFHANIGKQAKGTVLKARNKRHEAKGFVTHGCMVAELTFGFWTKMLLPKHEDFYWTPFHDAFPQAQPGIGFIDLAPRCAEVTELRNRIFHHEPVFQRNHTQDQHDILALIAWIDPALSDWIRPQLQIMSLLRQRPRWRPGSP